MGSVNVTRVGVVDYGAGNLHSVLRGLRAAGADPETVCDPAALARCERLVLPGVGAFASGIANLASRGLVAALREHVAQGKPLLGICLGAQLLMEWSDEFGRHEGLGLLPGGAIALPPDNGLRVPHVGWAPLAAARPWRASVLDGLREGDFAYFSHSYVCRPACADDVLATFPFGAMRPPAAIRRGSAIGLQFHPELSAGPGRRVLRAFTGEEAAVA